MEEIIEDAPVVGVPYGDMYLKFPTQQEAEEALMGYEGSIDVIGIISVTDNTDLENPIVTELEGWHVNTRGPMNHILGAYSVEVPSTPRRVWA